MAGVWDLVPGRSAERAAAGWGPDHPEGDGLLEVLRCEAEKGRRRGAPYPMVLLAHAVAFCDAARGDLEAYRAQTEGTLEFNRRKAEQREAELVRAENDRVALAEVLRELLSLLEPAPKAEAGQRRFDLALLTEHAERLLEALP